MKLIIGHTGSGKTAKAIEVGLKLAKTGKRVLFFDGESSAEHYLKATLDDQTPPVGFNIYNKFNTVQDVYSKFEYGGYDVYIIDTPNLFFDLEKLYKIASASSLYFVLGLESNIFPELNKDMTIIAAYDEMRSMFNNRA
jgi:cellulose biosynthesis protein BcsQ